MKKQTIIDLQQNDYLLSQGYDYTVYIVDESDHSDVLDLIDFKTLKEAEKAAKCLTETTCIINLVC